MMLGSDDRQMINEDQLVFGGLVPAMFLCLLVSVSGSDECL